MTNLDDTYRLELTGAEIMALTDAANVGANAPDDYPLAMDLDSALDKLGWICRFLDNDDLGGELEALRVK